MLTPRTAGSSWTLLRGVGSSTAKSFTSDARKIMYWYGSWTGGINSAGGLQEIASDCHSRVFSTKGKKSGSEGKATEHSTKVYALSDCWACGSFTSVILHHKSARPKRSAPLTVATRCPHRIYCMKKYTRISLSFGWTRDYISFESWMDWGCWVQCPRAICSLISYIS